MNKQASYYIEAYLKQYSEKTIKEYLSDIRDFYNFLHGVNYKDLETNQLYLKSDGTKLTKIDIINYKEKVINEPSNSKKKKNSEGTLKRKLYTMRSFFRFLQGEGFSVNLDIFDAKNIKYTPDSYDPISKEQAHDLAQAIREEHEHGEELFSYIVVATATSIRVNALCHINYNNITYNDVEQLYYITTRDVKEKLGKIISMPIHDWMYEMILQNKIDGDDRVFPNLTPDMIHDAITRYAPKIGLTGRITTHSLRKSAAVHEMKTRGNIQMGMKQLGHSNAQTFMDHYSKFAIDGRDMSGMRMYSQLDESIFDDFSKEQILKTLKIFNATAFEQLAYSLIDNKVR